MSNVRLLHVHKHHRRVHKRGDYFARREKFMPFKDGRSVNKLSFGLFILKSGLMHKAILKTRKLKHQKLMLKVPLLVSRRQGSEIQVP